MQAWKRWRLVQLQHRAARQGEPAAAARGLRLSHNGCEELRGVHAPAAFVLKDMADCLEALQSGRSSRDKGASSDHKMRLRWRVSEEALEHYRDFLGKATSVVLMRDERRGRLLLRFSAVDHR